jgi:Flp pilus assembly protein TadB
MENIIISRKGIFPLRTLTIYINNKKYLLKGNEELMLILPSKEFDIKMKMDWWNSTTRLKMKEEENRIVIKHKFSDQFFLVFLILLLIFLSMAYFKIVPPSVIIIFVLIYVLIQAYYLFFKSNEYFKVNLF